MKKKTELSSVISTEKPVVNHSVFVANSASLVGDISIGEHSSIWYGSVLRGDINKIIIGKRSNIQDLSCIHVENELPCIVGDDVTVGHRAILHACTLEDGVLIGMGAIILNGAIIKKGATIGAGAVVKEGTLVEENTLWAGIPAKQMKQYSQDKYEENKRWAAKYVSLAKHHQVSK
ncbi:gamma carbonic anhydrase family protein [bacterium]|nr:gamma carbonic anhydrase family protein [bacterium]|tara:strand:+ start:3089 stop:3616 length:528 start_codon:yes stop_codon:yes gene_type:complete